MRLVWSAQAEQLLCDRWFSSSQSAVTPTLAGGGLGCELKKLQTSNSRLTRPLYSLICFTTVTIAVSFAWLGVDDPQQWKAATALYIIGCKGVYYTYHINKC